MSDYLFTIAWYGGMTALWVYLHYVFLPRQHAIVTEMQRVLDDFLALTDRHKEQTQSNNDTMRRNHRMITTSINEANANWRRMHDDIMRRLDNEGEEWKS